MGLSLSLYVQRTMRLLGDFKQEQFNPADLKDYVNQGRYQTALESGCIRKTPPSAGKVMNLLPTTMGIGYAPYPETTVTISPQDQTWGHQAQAVPLVVSGAVTGYSITDPGDGYSIPPIVTVTGGGSGATATAELQRLNQAIADVQEYPFSAVPVDSFPGVRAVVAVRNIVVIWTNLRYPTFSVSYTRFQARYNPYTVGTFTYAPIIRCQRGQGEDGTIMFSPVPNQTYAWEWDCQCVPLDLNTDQDYDAIPAPWDTAPPFWASFLALQERADERSERISQARLATFRMMMRRARAFSQPAQMSNPY